MSNAKLLIRKAMVSIQSRVRPCVQVQAMVDEDMHAVLLEHFTNEVLFKRSSYSNGLPAGVPLPSPGLSPHLFALLKSDACPEITVKTMLAGQLYQANGIWDLMAFEYIAKRAFDSLRDMMAAVNELQTETTYAGKGAALAAIPADTAAEAEHLPPPANAA